MATIRKSITFTEQQDQWIKKQIEEGYFTNDSEYIRDLVRQDQTKKDPVHQLRMAIKEGLESGVSNKTIPEIMKAVEEQMKTNGKL